MSLVDRLFQPDFSKITTLEDLEKAGFTKLDFDTMGHDVYGYLWWRVVQDGEKLCKPYDVGIKNWIIEKYHERFPSKDKKIKKN